RPPPSSASGSSSRRRGSSSSWTTSPTRGSRTWYGVAGAPSGAREHAAERGSEHVDLVRRTDGGANRRRRSESGGGPHDHAFAKRPLVGRPRVVAELDEQEVPDRARDHLEPVLLERRGEPRQAVAIESPPPDDLVLGADARERRDLGGRAHVERP